MYYSYEKTKYVNSRTPVIITCSIHGDFTQLPWAHLKGQGCAKCADTKKTTEQFIENSRKVHGNKYTYDYSVYVTAKNPIIVTCPDHGNFTLKAIRHTADKNGCPKCSGRNKTTEEFIIESKKIYGNMYTYEKTQYTGTQNNVIITCKIHGNFIQNARTHIRVRTKRQKGCPTCSVRYRNRLTNKNE